MKSEKVWFHLLFACSLLLFTSAISAETVEYWDPVGKVTNSVEAVVVTGATTTLTGGWYVVTGEVSRAQINVTGTDETPANLILADGAKLTATDSSDYHPGIKVASGAALNIYAQSVDADTMGQLSAHGGYGGAGIGGAGEGGTCGTVNIYGGKLTAVGGEYAAGIGGGGKASKTGGTGGTISIYGGIVTANGENGGAAIGGGNRASGGTITIYGGEVIADNSANSDGAGIGGGFTKDGGTITITGGKVLAIGGTMSSGAAGIGGGSGGAGGDVTISGGTVVAKSGNKLVWDIGSGSGGGFSGEFVVKGGSVLLANSGNCRDEYPKNGDWTQVYCVTNQFVDSIVGKGVAVRFPSALFAYGDKDIFTDDARQVYQWLPEAASTYAIAYENGDGAFEELIVNKAEGQRLVSSFSPPSKVDATYAKPDGTSAATNAIPVDANRTELLGGNWYIVTNVVSMSQSLEVVGSANLILADGAKLTVQGKWSRAGIEVEDGNALTIWGQDGNTGTLDATGGSEGAGIGGGLYVKGGEITINGGQVTATGGTQAAGIGGGNIAAGGAVTVNGGTVVARAGYDAPYDIGRGWNGKIPGEFTVNGGSVLLADSGKCDSSPKNSDGELLYRVKIPFPEGFAEDVAISVTNILRRDGKSYAYGGRRLFVRDDGLYLYLPNGTYDKISLAVGTSGSATAKATVKDEATTAVLTTDAFLVNGASLMSTLPEGCNYDSVTGVLTVFGEGTYAFSGSPQELPLLVEVTTNATIVLSNVVITTTNDQPVLTIKEGATLTLRIAEGVSVFEREGGNGAIVVQPDANLVLGATGTATAATRLCVRGGVTGGTERVSLESGVILKEGSETIATLTTTCTGKPYLELGKSATITVPQLAAHLSAELAYGQADSQKVALAPTGGVYTVMQNDDIKFRFETDEGYGLDFKELSYSRIKGNQTVQSKNLPGVHPLVKTTYWDVNDAENPHREAEAIVIDAGTATLWDGNWYVVTGKVSRASIVVKGTVNLILADGAKLTAQKGDYYSHPAGIVVGPGNELTIWGQDAGTGTLVATGEQQGAGIGGSWKSACGTVTINGGTVTATGGDCAAGIGGGDLGAGGTVTINGGTVTATGGESCGAGIGGGRYGAGGTVTINGGTVIAKATDARVWDIGSGYQGNATGDSLFVTGGSVLLANSGKCRGGYPKKTEDTTPLRLITVTVNTNAAEGVLSPVTVSDIEFLKDAYKLGDYNTKGVQLIEGKLYFYLEKNRAYAFKVNDGEIDYYVLVPASEVACSTTATQYALFANGSPVVEGSGEGWAYDPGSGILSITGERCSVGGFALQGEVAICVKTNATLTTPALELMSSNSVLTIEDDAAVALEGSTAVCNRFISTGSSPAVDGSGSLTVTNGTHIFCGAERALGADVSFAVAPWEIVLAGEDEDSAVYVAADEVGDAKWVKVAPAVTLTVPVIEHATFCASNRVGRLEEPDMTEPGKVKYRVLPGDVVTLFFTADADYGLNEPVLELGVVSSDIELDASDLPQVYEKPSAVSYVDENGEARTVAAMVLVADLTELHDGDWYVVTGALTVAESIVVDGTANLILADGATLTAGYDGYDPQGAPGIGVPAGATLNVYAQAGGTGRLVARGTDGAAGIGGGYEGDCGTVNICGGQVLAEGGIYAAGIGGGYFGAGGTVNIYAGTVTAVGGTMSSADIGPGYFDWYDGTTDAEVTVTGGSLIAPAIWGPAMDDTGNLVHCVLVSGLASQVLDERVVIEGLDDYGARDIFAYVRPGETDGNIFLYLPNGEYEFKIGRAHYAATVNGLGTEAKLVYIEERPDPVPPVILAIEKGADAVTVTVETLPGLSYSLLRGATVESVRTGGTVVDGPIDATETTLTLTDTNPPAGSAFYSVEVK